MTCTYNFILKNVLTEESIFKFLPRSLRNTANLTTHAVLRIRIRDPGWVKNQDSDPE
jgi:hypothetical protein